MLCTFCSMFQSNEATRTFDYIVYQFTYFILEMKLTKLFPDLSHSVKAGKFGDASIVRDSGDGTTGSAGTTAVDGSGKSGTVF